MHEEAALLHVTVRLDQENFYDFAKLLVDKAAFVNGFYFGLAPKC